MTEAEPSKAEVALIVGGGPGISASCARLFAKNGVTVCVAARNPDKSVLQDLEKTHGVRRYACDTSEPTAVGRLFESVVRDVGAPTLVVHNIDGRVPDIFGKGITEADPGIVLDTLRNSAFSAFLNGIYYETIPVFNCYWISASLQNAVLLTYPNSGHGSLSRSTSHLPGGLRRSWPRIRGRRHSDNWSRIHPRLL